MHIMHFWCIFINLLCIRCIPSIHGLLCITNPNWFIFFNVLCIRIISIHALTIMDSLPQLINLYRYIMHSMHFCPTMDTYAYHSPFNASSSIFYLLNSFLSNHGHVCVTYPNWCIFIDPLCIRCISLQSWTRMHNLLQLSLLYRYIMH